MKKLLLIIGSFITLHMHAAEMKMEIETAKPSFPAGWLTSLPADVANMIADFLFYEIEETEQEFIQRTKALKLWKEISLEYLNHLPNYSIYHQEYLHVAESADNNIIALLHKGAYKVIGKKGFKASPTLLIVNKKNNQLLHRKELDDTNKEFRYIAIPRDGNRVGTLHSERYLKSITQETYGFKHIITVSNLVTEKIQTSELPDYFELSHKHPTIAFNKQGTHLIVHGTKPSSKDDFDEEYGNYMIVFSEPIEQIIPLTTTTPDPNADNKKTLQRYFAQQLICKDLNKQLTLTQ